jgi:uncharacterized membrane protein YdjX (TVP38/TMEM64 family)
MKIGRLIELLFGTIVLFALFLTVSFIVRQHSPVIDAFILKSYYVGIISFPIVAFIDAVTLPVALPIIPAASQIYGVGICSLLLLIGWTLGMMFSFYISRKYGLEVMKRFISTKGVYEIEGLMPCKHIFGTVVFLRLFLPLDISSFALGAFTKIDFKTYFFASFIGMIPSAIYLSYVGSLSFSSEVIGLFLGLGVVFVGYLFYSKYLRCRI